MSERAVKHATFVIERTYDAPPALVFAAWASQEAKASWAFCDEDWKPTKFELDFRVGGREQVRTGPAGGAVHAVDGCYYDIVPNERIVYAYDMHLGERHISVSLATVEFKPAGKGTRLVFTEQGAFLDGYDDVAGREEGTRIALGNLAAALQWERASA
jgi:uncharacterized protein YndB with AHSA1/START domain